MIAVCGMISTACYNVLERRERLNIMRDAIICKPIYIIEMIMHYTASRHEYICTNSVPPWYVKQNSQPYNIISTFQHT